MVWVGFIVSLLFGGYLITQGVGLLIMAAFIDSFSGMKRSFAEWVLAGVGVGLFIAGVTICYFAVKYAPFTISVSV